jgi:repressor LexA
MAQPREGHVTRELSPRQRQVLEILTTEIRRHGRGPSLRALGERLGGLSPAAVHLHLDALAAKGYLTWPPGRPQEARLLQPARPVPPLGVWQVPVVGTIAAGAPIDAFEAPEGHVLIESSRVRGGRPGADLYALVVRGDSMVDACIQDGDVVVIRRQDTARDGETVVALLDGERATLKRFYREADRVRLAPANPYYPDIYARDVRVQGAVVGVLRYG